MIQVTISLYDSEDDEILADVWMKEAPHVGELIWLLGDAQRRSEAAHKRSSWTVKQIAHWIAEPGPTCRPEYKDATHHIAAYVVPTPRN